MRAKSPRSSRKLSGAILGAGLWVALFSIYSLVPSHDSPHPPRRALRRDAVRGRTVGATAAAGHVHERGAAPPPPDDPHGRVDAPPPEPEARQASERLAKAPPHPDVAAALARAAEPWHPAVVAALERRGDEASPPVSRRGAMMDEFESLLVEEYPSGTIKEDVVVAKKAKTADAEAEALPAVGVGDATHTQSQATTWVVFTHPTKAPDVRKSNVKALRKHMPFVTPFPTNWGFDASCRETLRQEHVSVHEHYAGGSLGGHIEAGKLGQWCTVLRFLRHCAETHGRVCVSIEDDVVVSPDEVFNLTQVVQTLTFDTAMVRLGPKSCTDCIVAYDPTTCLELVQLVQRNTIDNPTDLLFGWYKHYTRGPYFGHLLDPSSSPKTSLVRSLGMLSIRSVNKNIQ